MYSSLDPKSTTELSLIRHGWFSPEFELTNGVNLYGKIAYPPWLSQRGPTVESAAGRWIFHREETFSRTIFISDENDVRIGTITREWFSLKSTLTLQTGFRADFYTKSIFSRENVWESDADGKIIRIRGSFLNLTNRIYIEHGMTPAALIPLLIFVGEHLIILRGRRKSSH